MTPSGCQVQQVWLSRLVYGSKTIRRSLDLLNKKQDILVGEASDVLERKGRDNPASFALQLADILLSTPCDKLIKISSSSLLSIQW